MDKKAVLVVKSEFVPLIVGLQVLGIGVSCALFVAGAIDIFFLIVSSIFGVGLGLGSLFGLIFLICAILFPTALYEIRRKNSSQTYFRFYSDYIEFCYFTGPLMNRRQGRLYYSDIVDMMQYSSFMQNFVSLETIRLYAPETRFYDRHKNFVGIEIPDIKISRGVGEKIQKILDRWHELNNAVPIRGADEANIDEIGAKIPDGIKKRNKHKDKEDKDKKSTSTNKKENSKAGMNNEASEVT